MARNSKKKTNKNINDYVSKRKRGFLGQPFGSDNVLRAFLLDVQRKDINLSLVYTLASLFYVFCVGYGSPPEDAATRQIVNYSHVSIPIIFLGLAVLPIRLLWLAFVVFAFSFVFAELVMVRDVSTPGWTAAGMIISMLVSAGVGGVGGIVVRYLMKQHPKGTIGYYPEKMAFIGGITSIVLGSVISCAIFWINFYDVYPIETINKMQLLIAMRIMRLALVGAGATLLLLSMPAMREIVEIALQASLFWMLGFFQTQEMSFYSTIEAPLLALILIFIRPVHTSIGGILVGLPLYVLMTGAYLSMPLDFTPQEFKDDFISNTLYIIVLSVAVLRVKSRRVERDQVLTLHWRKKAQELARFGYFLYDVEGRKIYFDTFACSVLNVAAIVKPEEFLRRVHPLDRDGIFAKEEMTDGSDGRVFPFRLSMGQDWSEDGINRYFIGYILFEHIEGEGHNVIYGVVSDVTNEQEREEHLRLVLAQLSKTQGQQTQLFSMISHELRTPAAMLSMLADQLDDGRSWQAVGPQMRAVLNQLLAILGDMRQTVRPEQNLPIRIEPFCPQDVAKSIVQAFHTMAEEKGISINLQLEKVAGQKRASDRVRLTQVLSNLVKNAILHSQATEISIKYFETSNQIGNWIISDNGRNITPEHHQHLFQPFVRGNSGGARSDGSGLGLYIAKGAIELLGGTLEYVERPLSGAEFKILLPMSLSQLSEHEEESVTAEITDELSALSILIIEDSETMGELLLARLSKSFKNVKWIEDGGAALAWVALNQVDVVICDLFMPGMNGDEVVRDLRARGFLGKIIGMTATEIEDDTQKFTAAGANSVLIKPLQMTKLIQSLKKNQR